MEADLAIALGKERVSTVLLRRQAQQRLKQAACHDMRPPFAESGLGAARATPNSTLRPQSDHKVPVHLCFLACSDT